jgi:curli production assembly/transport component CsgE
VTEDARVVGGLSLGYDTMLREYGRLRPLQQARPDSTAPSARQVAEAVARLARPAAVDGVRRLEVDGLVVDQTITRLGREFYLAFYRQWVPPPEAVAFTVEVVEQPDRGINTVVRVQVNDELVFQTRLSPRADESDEDVARAVAAAYRRLQRRGGPAPAY